MSVDGKEQPKHSGATRLGPPPGNSREPTTPYLKPGEEIGSYRIVEVVGQGGMGVVYRCRHKIEAVAKERGDVAMKVILPEYAEETEFRERFIHEATVGMKAEDRGIAKVHDLIVEKDQLALAMEFIEGQDLSDAIPTFGMSPTAAAPILAQIAKAADHLHHLNIIHRDLKPSNIKLRANGSPVILDFGIAKDEDANSEMTQYGKTMGTVGYMAPEQMRNAKSVGPASDQYAIGIIAYKMMSGGYPWPSEDTAFQIYDRKIMGELPKLSDRNHSISQAVSSAVSKALAPKPVNRYPNCKAFADALTEATTLNSIPVIKPSKKTAPWLAIGLFGLLGVAGVAAAAMAYQNFYEEQATNSAEPLPTVSAPSPSPEPPKVQKEIKPITPPKQIVAPKSIEENTKDVTPPPVENAQPSPALESIPQTDETPLEETAPQMEIPANRTLAEDLNASSPDEAIENRTTPMTKESSATKKPKKTAKRSAKKKALKQRQRAAEPPEKKAQSPESTPKKSPVFSPRFKMPVLEQKENRARKTKDAFDELDYEATKKESEDRKRKRK